MPCIAVKTNGLVCGRRDTGRIINDTHPEHMILCNIHVQQYNRQYEHAGRVHHQEGKCIHYMSTFRWCDQDVVEGHNLCERHQAAAERKVFQHNQRIERNRRIHGIFTHFLNMRPNIDWRFVTTHIHAMAEPIAIRRAAAYRYYLNVRVAMLEDPMFRLRPLWRFALYWDWLENGAQGEPPDVINQIPANMLDALAPPPALVADNQLARIARDGQNVHTTAVSQQTNSGMDKLLSIEIPNNQETEKTLAIEWMKLAVSWSEMLKVLVDVHQWFLQKTCRIQDDQLYRRALRGLVAIINRSEYHLRDELYKRLWEECLESTGMCCEGHLSRLCNVLVGYDDAFRPPVSLGELIQQKMAAISEMDISDADKRRLANEWFDDVAYPDADRVSWLDAF